MGSWQNYGMLTEVFLIIIAVFFFSQMFPTKNRKKNPLETLLNPNAVWNRTGGSNLVSKHDYKD